MNKVILILSLLLAGMLAWTVYTQKEKPSCTYVIPGISGTFCKEQSPEKGIYYTNGKIEVRIL